MSHDRKPLPNTVRLEDLSDAIHKEINNPNSQLYKIFHFYDSDTFNDSLEDTMAVFEIINKQKFPNKKMVLAETLAESILINEGDARNEKHLAIKEAILHYLHEHTALIKKLLTDKVITSEEIKAGIENVFVKHDQNKSPALSKSVSHASLSPANASTSNRHRLTGAMMKSSSTTHLTKEKDVTSKSSSPKFKPKS